MSKGSILVVDDESEIREGLELLLTSEGYGVSSAETGESGLAKLGEQPFDLLLLDVSLPDRNGLELLREIRKRDPQLSVVLITAYGSIEMARAAFKGGALDYITKPWSNDELLAQVAQAVESRRLREENLHLKRALKQRFQFSKYHRQERKDADAFRSDHPGGALALHRADQRRKRHRQGAHRQSHSLGLDARGQSFRPGKHWLAFPWICSNHNSSAT